MSIPFRISDRVTLLGTNLFNLYLIKGDTNAIIEGGVSGIASPFLNQLSQLEVPLETISHLIILHAHFDHMMVFHILKERYPWMTIVSSSQNRTTFSSGRIIGKIFESDRKMTLTLMEKGLISEAPTLQPCPSFPLDLPVEEGDVLDLGKGTEIRFFDSPGHAPDGICAYLESQGILFCSDSAGSYTPPDFFRPNYWSCLDDAEKSIGKMKQVDPEVLCRGHFGISPGRELVRHHLQRSTQCIDDFKDWVLKRIQSGESVEAMTHEGMKRLSRGFLELFPREDNVRLWRLLILRTLEHFGMEVEETLTEKQRL